MINWDLLKETVKNHMNFDSCGHGFDHVERVYNIAQKLMQNLQNIDTEIVALASLLHDADDYKLFGQDASDNLTNAKRIMAECDVEEKDKAEVLDIIANMGYSKLLAGIRPKTIEGMVVSDADMIDATGINGIIRTLNYAYSRCLKYGTPVFDKNEWPETNLSVERYKSRDRKSDNCINHFFEKTLRLGNLMMTEKGRKMAKVRLGRMVEFLRGYFDENDVPEWNEYLENYLKQEKIDL
jgi:uncharacterized protein